MDSRLELPVYLFHQGTSLRAYEFMGAHPYSNENERGYVFRVWAPKASNVYLTGNFNGWDYKKDIMHKLNNEGIWELYMPDIEEFDVYKYVVEDQSGELHIKADPYGFHMETRPATGSKIYDLEGFQWSDDQWIQKRSETEPYNQPINIYEVHAGSWKRYPDGNTYSYEKLAEELIPYVKDMGYTHIELMPISEYPYDGSWGYQVMGYYAVTSRYGTPKDFMAFIDRCHEAGIGVILDWVPGHFPKDGAGLYNFDGDCCYEYEDPLKREHSEWGTRIFDWGKNEVKSFLLSNAVFWLDKFHVDGIRVDAVASMLYLDYNRSDGQWRPNINGGRENLEAIAFLKDLNTAVFANYSNVLMIAEESTAWPLVTKPVDVGGLGFNYKWNMGWMNDTLSYMKTDSFFKKGCHHRMTFSMSYAYSENYILPLSHDEVVHMKGSLIRKMPGTREDQFANLRAYFGYMMAHPGKKLLFMGGEFAQSEEWKFDGQLSWELLNSSEHLYMQKFSKSINKFYVQNPAFWEQDQNWQGFQWIEADDCDNNIYAFLRRDKVGESILIICNFSPVRRINYVIGVDKPGRYKNIFSTDSVRFGGKGRGTKQATSKEIAYDQFQHQIKITLPPLSTLYYKLTNGGD